MIHPWMTILHETQKKAKHIAVIDCELTDRSSVLLSLKIRDLCTSLRTDIGSPNLIEISHLLLDHLP